MRLASSIHLFLAFTAFVSQAALADNRFELEVGGERLRGKGVGSPYRAARRIGDIDDGKSAFVALSWMPRTDWRLSLAYAQAFHRYEDPANYYCPANAGLLTWYQYCQHGSYDREGRVRDDFRAVTMRVERSWEVGARGRVNVGLGYEQARWRTRDDHEILTFSTCFGGAVYPRRLPNCTPLDLRSRANGLLSSVSLQYRFSESIGAEIGVHWQTKRYVIHRNEAIPRFCTRQQGWSRISCESWEPAFVPANASTDHDWSWLFGEFSWRIDNAWEIALTAESGGSRDWDSVGTLVRYRW